MTSPDSVFPHIGWQALAVVADLVHQTFQKMTDL